MRLFRTHSVFPEDFAREVGGRNGKCGGRKCFARPGTVTTLEVREVSEKREIFLTVTPAIFRYVRTAKNTLCSIPPAAEDLKNLTLSFNNNRFNDYTFVCCFMEVELYFESRSVASILLYLRERNPSIEYKEVLKEGIALRNDGRRKFWPKRGIIVQDTVLHAGMTGSHTFCAAK